MTDLVLTRDQVRSVDRLAVERFGMSGLVLMENAGRNAAEIIRRQFPDVLAARIVCGSGNNGGDGCVIARHLHNAGWEVELLVAGERERLSADLAVNLGIVEAMGLPCLCSADPAAQLEWVRTRTSAVAVVVDALLGTGFSGQVRADAAGLIDALNRTARAAMVAVDVPSGLDCQTGEPSNAMIMADLTITFVASKYGFRQASAAPFVGRILVTDIGAPRQLVEDVAAGRL